jgi:hypothetical protein
MPCTSRAGFPPSILLDEEIRPSSGKVSVIDGVLLALMHATYTPRRRRAIRWLPQGATQARSPAFAGLRPWGLNRMLDLRRLHGDVGCVHAVYPIVLPPPVTSFTGNDV